VNVGVASLVGSLGPEAIVVSGAVVSIVNERDAGVFSGAPLALRARTSNVCAPGASATVGVKGDPQEAKVAASKRHWNETAPLAPVNVNVGVVSLVGRVGPPVIVESSAATVKVRVAGVEPGKSL